MPRYAGPAKSTGRRLSNRVDVFTGASFFNVRNDVQVLLHDLDLNSKFRKVELFAPTFHRILADRSPVAAIPFVNDATTIFILLNPLAKSISEIEPSEVTDRAGWMCEDWVDLQYQRSLILGEFDGLNEAERRETNTTMMDRVNQMPYEVTAWQAIQEMSKKSETVKFVEFLAGLISSTST